jgi:hypothetical protein
VSSLRRHRKKTVWGRHHEFQQYRGAQVPDRVAGVYPTAPRFAFRTGHLRWRGWKCEESDAKTTPETKAKELNWQPDLDQKEIDIKIGLDIAWLASKKIVDIIAIASGDTDFVPAMKFARREGVRIKLITFVGNTPHNNLVEHSDYITEIDLKEIAAAVGR